MRRIRKNNQGLTLVELLVTFAILLIVMGSIITFLVTTTTLFKSSSTETNIQNEAQLASNRIHDMLISASAGVTYYYVDGSSGNKSQVYQDPASGTASAKALYIYNWEDNPAAGASEYGKKVMIYCIIFNPAKEELDYIAYNYSTDSSGNIVEVDPAGDASRADETNILSKYVTDFSVKLYNASTGAVNTLLKNQVYYKITFSLNGKNYTTENTVTLRNNVEINRNLSDVAVTPAELKSTVQFVKIIQPSSTQVVVPTSTLQFKARVTGLNLTNDDVSWTCTGNTSQETTIDNNGLLKVGSNEAGQTIQIVAASKQDPSVKSDALVVTTSYLGNVSLPGTVTFDSKTRTAPVTLTITGKNLDAAKISSQITAAKFSLTSDGTTAANDCSIMDLENTVTAADTIQYTFNIDASAAAADQSRTLKVSVTYPEGVTTKTASLTFTTPAILPAIKSITAVQIVAVSTGRSNISDTLWRGETGSYRVQIKREGDTDWKDAASDENCTENWYLDTDGAENYVTLGNAATGTVQATVSKSSYAKNYKYSADFSLGVTVTDTAASGTTTITKKIYVPAVTMKLAMKTQDGITYDNYITNTYSSDLRYSFSHYLTVTLAYKGLVLSNGELSQYITWDKNNSYTVIYADYSNNVFDLQVYPNWYDTSYYGNSVEIYLGDSFGNSNLNNYYNAAGTVAFSCVGKNIATYTRNGTYTFYDDYVPLSALKGTHYTSQGLQYYILNNSNNRKLSFKGDTYTEDDYYYCWSKRA